MGEQGARKGAPQTKVRRPVTSNSTWAISGNPCHPIRWARLAKSAPGLQLSWKECLISCKPADENTIKFTVVLSVFVSFLLPT